MKNTEKPSNIKGFRENVKLIQILRRKQYVQKHRRKIEKYGGRNLCFDSDRFDHCWHRTIVSATQEFEAANKSSSDYSKSEHSVEGTKLLVEGLMYMVVGPVLGWMLTCGLYAFGELVDKTAGIHRVLYKKCLQDGVFTEVDKKTKTSLPSVSEAFWRELKEYSDEDLPKILKEQAIYYTDEELAAIRAELKARCPSKSSVSSEMMEELQQLQAKGLIQEKDVAQMVRSKSKVDETVF